MTKEQAKKLLNLSRWYTREELEDAYRRQRDVYYPPMHEIFVKHSEEEVKEQMLEEMTDYNYAYPMEDPERGPSGRDISQYAFMRFASVCDAYHILLEDKSYVPYRLDANDFDGYLLERFGKVGGRIWKGLTVFSRFTLWLLIPLLVAWVAAGIGEQLWIGWLATAVFVAFHWGVPMVMDPAGFLLYILKGWWTGACFGAQYGLLITKLYSIIFCSLGTLIWWIIKFIFRPCLIIEDLEFSLGEKRHFKRRCKALIQKRYDRAKEQVEQFGREYMVDRPRRAHLAYAVASKWSEEARKSALQELLEEVEKNNPQYAANIARARSDAFSLKSFEAQLRRESERASKWIDWLATDSYGAGPFWYYNYDEDFAMQSYEDHERKMKSSYDYVELQRMHFALDAQIARQRQLMECYVMLYDLI